MKTHLYFLFALCIFQTGLLSTAFCADTGTCLFQEKVVQRITKELVNDGYLEDSDSDVYFFLVSDHMVTNSKVIRGKTFQKYITLLLSLDVEIKKYWGYYDLEGRGYFYGSLDQRSWEKVEDHYRKLNTKGSYSHRSKSSKHKTNWNFSISNFSNIQEELEKDKLIKSGKRLSLQIHNDNWIINGKKLSPKQVEKYKQLIIRDYQEIMDEGLRIELGDEEGDFTGSFHFHFEGNQH